MRAKNVVDFKVVSSFERASKRNSIQRGRESDEKRCCAKDIYFVWLFDQSKNIKWLIRMILICLTFYSRFFSFCALKCLSVRARETDLSRSRNHTHNSAFEWLLWCVWTRTKKKEMCATYVCVDSVPFLSIKNNICLDDQISVDWRAKIFDTYWLSAKRSKNTTR